MPEPTCYSRQDRLCIFIRKFRNARHAILCSMFRKPIQRLWLTWKSGLFMPNKQRCSARMIKKLSVPNNSEASCQKDVLLALMLSLRWGLHYLSIAATIRRSWVSWRQRMYLSLNGKSATWVASSLFILPLHTDRASRFYESSCPAGADTSYMWTEPVKVTVQICFAVLMDSQNWSLVRLKLLQRKKNCSFNFSVPSKNNMVNRGRLCTIWPKELLGTRLKKIIPNKCSFL